MSEFPKLQISETANTLIKVGSVALAIVAIAGIRNFYINEIYVPKLEIVDSDFEKGTANIKYKNTIIPLKGDSTFMVTGNWGVKLATLNIDGESHYHKIELVKNGMVYNYL